MRELLDRITEGNCTDKKYRVEQSFEPEKFHLTQACDKPTPTEPRASSMYNENSILSLM